MQGLFKNLPFMIVLGICLGIFCGIFFGERCAFLNPVGEAYVMLLRMSVIPYLACSLINGIGRLSVEEAKRLFKKGWPYFILIWIVTVAIIYSLRFLMPTPDANLSHHDLVHLDKTPFDFLELFIPTNPFKALANDAMPSIIVFCLFFGASLVKLNNKQALLSSLDTILAGLDQVTTWISYLAPIGAFALMAAGAGTLRLADLDKIQLYLLAVLIGSCFLALWLFPVIVTSLTDIKYKDLFKELPTMFLLSFTAANPLIAFPYLLKAVKNLAVQYQITAKDSEKTCEAVVPIALNFPTAGNFFALLFIVFLAAYYGLSFNFVDYLKLNSIGFIALFGPSAQIGSAITFLMDLLQIPADGHNLYLNSFLISRYFVALVSVSGVTTLTLLVVFSYANKIHLRAKKLLSNASLSLCIFGSCLMAGRQLELSPKNITPSFAHLSIDMIVPVSVNLTAEKPLEIPNLPDTLKEDALQRIRKTHTLKVGYNPDVMPFSYFNASNELVGFDIAMAYQLAWALNASLELVPFKWSELSSSLQGDLFDIAMSGILATDERIKDLSVSSPYMQGNFALVVHDFQRSAYNDYTRIKSRKGLKIAVLKGTALPEIAQHLFPNAETVLIDQVNEFLKPHIADTFFWTEEAAHPWTLFHPQFAVVRPSPGLAKTSYTYLMASHSPQLKAYVNQWLTHQHTLLESQYKYWFLGQTGRAKSRWCIMNDVLHWSK